MSLHSFNADIREYLKIFFFSSFYRTVKIIRLISKDTIEEGMLQIAQDKLQLERDVTGFEGMKVEE